MTWQLADPAAVDALLALAETIPAIDVADGPKIITGTTNTRSLVIAYSDGKTDAVTHDLDDTANYSPNQGDRFTVNCRAEALIETTVSAARTASYGVLTTFANLIYPDPTLGDVVMQALITGVAYAPIQAERGYFAVVQFGVTCEAFTGA